MSDWQDLVGLVSGVKTGKVTSRQLIERCLKRIEETNKEYNAVLSLVPNALVRADEIDRSVVNNDEVGPLAGVPFVVKDNFLVAGTATTAASHMLEGFIAPYSATAVKKLEDAGAICVAKANLDAFAHGGSTENSDYGVTKNPVDASRVPGGSSGGSAASVALGIAPFALGTDTGGSIRQPASFCGVVGYKPTYGLVSRNGVVAMASSTDVIGPLTTSIADAEFVLDVIAGKDPFDSTTIELDVTKTDDDGSISGKKVGVVKEYFSEGLDPEVKNTVDNAIKALKENGAIIEEVSLPSLALALAVYYIVVPAELSSNLSRYDGQRYQYSADSPSSLAESYLLSRTNGFGDEAKRRIMIGTHVLSSGYYDAYYNKAQQVRTTLIAEFAQAFKEYDFLVGPVAPTIAPKIGELSDDPLQMYLLDLMTVAANLAGIPAVSVPSGSAHNMPVGLQIMAAQKQDKKLLAFARQFEGLES